jgi:flagellar biosynthesis protein FlhF
MKIKRFVAATMREAIRLVRDEQGPDAVILSNRRVDEGVEVVAAVDYDEALMRHAARGAAPAEIGPAPAATSPVPAAATEKSAAAEKPAVAESPAGNTGGKISVPVEVLAPAAAPAPISVAAFPQIVWADESGLGKLRSELSGLRRLVETQLSTLTLGQFRNARPLHAAVMRELVRLGVEIPLAREICSSLPENLNDADARKLPLNDLTQRLPIAENDLLETGGVFALIGPTGVGKTTTLAKLAARYAARHGIRQVALISTDHYRIGAQEQLYTYGRRLGVPVYSADNAASLTARLDELADCKLVLIDTAGLGPRDSRLPMQLAELSGGGRKVNSYLVLAANSHAADLEHVTQKFRSNTLCGAILTKLDESTRVGAALSVLIRQQLPLAYVCDGQRVPEDLQRADARTVVQEAIRLARAAAVDTTEIEDEIDASALAFA